MNLLTLPIALRAYNDATDLVNRQRQRRDYAHAQVKELHSEVSRVNLEIYSANVKVYHEKLNVQNARAKIKAAQVVNRTLADIVAKVAISCSHAHVLDNLGKVHSLIIHKEKYYKVTETISTIFQFLVKEVKYQFEMGPFAQLGNIVKSIQNILPEIKSLGELDSTDVLTQTAIMLEETSTQANEMIEMSAARFGHKSTSALDYA